MMLIIGGIILLIVLGAAGVFVVLSGKSSGGESTTVSSVKPGVEVDKTPIDVPSVVPPAPLAGYQGVKIGPIVHKSNNVTGNVYAADDKTFHITQFSYDGLAPDAHFAVSKEADLKTPVKLHDEKDTEVKLGVYTTKNIKIKTTETIDKYKSFGVYCFSAGKAFGVVEIPTPFTVPSEKEETIKDPNEIEPPTATIVDSKNIIIKAFKYTGTDPIEIFAYAGKGKEIKKDVGTKISTAKINEADAKDVTITTNTESWEDYDWVALIDETSGVVKGKIMITKPLTVPLASTTTVRRRASKGRRAAGTLAVKAAPRKARLLVCSYGESGVVKTMVPSDGLCDVVFYTDVTYDGEAEAIVPKDGGPAFDVLKSAATKYTKTSFGTSMATGTIADAAREKKSELMAAMADLFGAKMFHFGMLNVENIEDYDNLKDADLQYIKVANEFLKGKSSARLYHKALGLSLRDGSKGAKILDAAKRVTDDFPELTMVIIKLHTENYGPAGDHWPLAPNPDDVDLSEHNALSLAAIKDDMEEQLQAISSQGKYALLSFAMFARTYRMKKTWNGAAAREMSESSLNMDYSSVCKMKTEKDSEDTGTLYATDEHKKFLALFDSASTFTKKTSKRLSVMPQNFTGLAVYNVEMDDYKGACGKGKFVRLKAIKSALAA
ncbi:uncharacterized protein LOC119457953 [Dermacentor silvarum]|uniref:uncharacterized protein LOC119457953 n=1 Tax=Dermacentor silvarum TaxID=543639 RepID=UPI0021019C7A|nr:uncharacterized protein LOC119457953 [Dermacentor silvarum]